MTFSPTIITTAFICFAAQLQTTAAFHVPSAALSSLHRHRSSASSSSCANDAALVRRSRTSAPSTSTSSTSLRGLFDDDDENENNPNAIPPELKDEIYRAEANTPAAQGRQQRILSYALLTVAGVSVAFFNAFLSDLRFGDGSPSSDLAYYGFDWVKGNFLAGFLFTNKIGGGLGLLGAGLSGTLAEVEIRSKKENAEKIWSEMQRRKALKDQPTSRANRKKQQKNKNKQLAQKSKRDMTGKQKKRMSALVELMEDDVEEEVEETKVVEEQKVEDVATSTTTTTADKSGDKDSTNDNDNGIVGKIKGFYKQADSMAASQALLLNKELEDRGVLDKITDESGLRVIGKEQAAAEAEAKTKQDEK